MYVDTHCHYFNARYLPLVGIGRKTARLPRPLARFLARCVLAITPHDQALDDPVDEAEFLLKTLATKLPGDLPADWTLEEAIDGFVARLPDDVLLSHDFTEYFGEEMWRVSGTPDALALAGSSESVATRRELLRKYLHRQEQSDALMLHRDASQPGLSGFLQFVGNMTSRETELAQQHRAVSRSGTDEAAVGLFVHHMMDMEPAYESGTSYDWEQAIRRTRRLAENAEGRLLVFIAFDPYRLLSGWRSAHGRSGLQVVADALDNGFAGVKFYAPTGYRPSNNEDPQTVFAWRRDQIDPSQLNKHCADLIEMCAAKNIPIMAHCTPGGMEVNRAAHSGWNADPFYWEPWLKKYPQLRLCFGHAGGHGRWLDEPDPQDWLHSSEDGELPPRHPWADIIIDYCDRYENVYADLSHFGEVLQGEGRLRLADALEAAFLEKPAVARKLIYASDYPMPLPGRGWNRYFNAMLEMVRSSDVLKRHERLLFRENALRFLDVPAFLKRCGRSLTAAEQLNLTRFIAEQQSAASS